MKKSKSKLIKTIIISIITIISLMFILIIAITIYVVFFGPKTDIRDISSSISTKIEFDKVSNDDERLNWYDSIDEGANDIDLIKNRAYFNGYNDKNINEIFSIESNNCLYVFAPSKHVENSISDGVICIKYLKKNNYFSQPCDLHYYSYTGAMTNAYKYYLDTTTAENIVDMYAVGNKIFSDNNNRIYVGAWNNKEELESMTIDGNPVDEIIPVSVGDNQYYFWYYSGLDLEDKLSTIDYSDYTLEQVIDVLDIRYTKQENK